MCKCGNLKKKLSTISHTILGAKITGTGGLLWEFGSGSQIKNNSVQLEIDYRKINAHMKGYPPMHLITVPNDIKGIYESLVNTIDAFK